MTNEELKRFRETVADPRLKQLYDKTEINDGTCYIDSLEISFIDGRSWGAENQIKAHGFVWKNGRSEEYIFEEYDVNINSFFENHKDSIFVSDGSLVIQDELLSMKMDTIFSNFAECSKIFPELLNIPEIQREYNPVAYHKMMHVNNNQEQRNHNITDYYMKDEIISKEMILKGLENGVVKIINNPNDREIAAQIGEKWFYFAGQENNDLPAKEYLELYTNEEIAEYIEAVINEEPIKGYSEEDASEWLYYRAILLESDCKDYPSIEEIRSDYNKLMDLIKDIRTIEQAEEFQRKYNIPVEINGYSIDDFVNGAKNINGRADNRGTNADIEWIRYESFGCLSYIYDRFNGKPWFDVYSEKIEDEFIRDITINALTDENYKQWIYDTKERCGETVINTKINYLYRDAEDYKVHNKCIIKGTFTDKQKKQILDSLESGEFFIPGKVSLPAKQFENWNYETDHPWFELDEDSFEETIDSPTINVTANKLTKLFVESKGDWESYFSLGDSYSERNNKVKYPYLSGCEDFYKIQAACSDKLLEYMEKSIFLYEETNLILLNEEDGNLYHKYGDPFFVDAIAWYSGLLDTEDFILNFGDKNRVARVENTNNKESLTDKINSAKSKQNNTSEKDIYKPIDIEK